MSQPDVHKYLEARLDKFESKLDSLFDRFDNKLEAHSLEDRDNFKSLNDRIYEINGSLAGVRAKASVFGLVGGLIASAILVLKNIFTGSH